MAQTTEKVLFDTDIGSDIDDAIALAYLLSQPRCELLGVTTCTGEPDKRAELASAICRHVGRGDIPVHAGCPQGMLTDLPQKHAQQAAALGQWDRQRQFEPCSAVEFLRQTIRAHPGEVTLLATGPMNNLGILFAVDPEIPAMLKQLVLMCGRFLTEGGPEWNALNDPYATAITYGFGPRGAPARHVSFGLDVTMKCTLPADECRQRFTAKVLEPVRDFAEVWFQRQDTVYFHDPLAAAGVFEPGLCEYTRGQVTVQQTPPDAGKTAFAEQDDGPHLVASEVEPERFFAHYFEIVS